MCGIHWCDAQHVRGAHTNRQKAYEKASVFILARRVKTSTALSKGMFWRDYQNISLLLAHSSFIKMRELKWYLSNPPFRKWCQNWHPPTKHFDLYWAIQFSYKHSQGKRVCPAFPEVLFLKPCPLCAHPLGFSCQTHCKGSGSKWTLVYIPPSIIQVYSRSFCLQNNTAEQKQWVDWVNVVVVFSSRLTNMVINYTVMLLLVPTLCGTRKSCESMGWYCPWPWALSMPRLHPTRFQGWRWWRE